MHRRNVLVTTAAVTAATAGSLAVASAGTTANADMAGGTTVHARLNSLNNSGVVGRGTITVDGRKLRVTYDARKLAPGLPHAAHIHYGPQARHECPTVAVDRNHDFRLNVAEGAPRYGPVAKSLTTRGDTSPASIVAVGRFPTAAPNGRLHYARLITAKRVVARAIRRGEGVLVVHGVDYNQNGRYDFKSAGKSELDPKLPAEATDPAACGVLR
jgi:hypothetical protein